MQNAKRIILLFHVDMGESAPDAAHRIESTPLQRLCKVELVQRLFDDIARLVEIAVSGIHQAQRTERKSCGIAGLAVLHRHHIETAAAQIRDETVGGWN